MGSAGCLQLLKMSGLPRWIYAYVCARTHTHTCTRTYISNHALQIRSVNPQQIFAGQTGRRLSPGSFSHPSETV